MFKAKVLAFQATQDRVESILERAKNTTNVPCLAPSRIPKTMHELVRQKNPPCLLLRRCIESKEARATPREDADSQKVIGMKWIWHTRREWGRTTLAIWLIATGAISFFGMAIPYSGQLLAIVAVAAGILILFGR
jgi:hypothetical protein